MTFYNPFHRRDANTRTCWGYTFQLTPQHPTAADFEPLKHSCDRLADAALERINKISPPPRSVLPRSSDRDAEPSLSHPEDEKKVQSELEANEETSTAPVPQKRDLYALLKDHSSDDEVLERLWKEVNTVPDWVDWAQIERGQEVFYRYGGPNLTGLAFQSLLGGMGANRVVETLARTGGFRTTVARHRLYETTQHILQVTLSLDSIKPGGAGFASSIRVRLLHAAVRSRIMALATSRPSYFDVSTLGIPINDLDCCATIGTFSATLVWLALPRQGIFLRQQEIEDYLALWRYIGYLTGTPVDHISTPVKAQKFMESLLMLEIQPSATSKVLAGNVLSSLAGQPPQLASLEFLEASARWLNGNELCDALGLGNPGLWYKMLMAGQCAFFVGLCYSYRAIPMLDRRKIKTLRKLFWLVIVEGKHGLKEETNFDFKYIPDLHKTTHLEGPLGTGVMNHGVERRNLIALGIAGAVLGLGLVLISRFAKLLLGYMF